ncbi:SDR family NAD(P)-dependent oxidoreductase [Atopomonas sediminilitoris]|uniref:SDR family NAD(P)-dependent oxidoreductase n=1 Tax=Atopomonas sediminilitoris TaxID=2919919 RepID=UPI001F4EDC57|nr:SDR family NAD(P)-dependent oxidoreductase [Atopomonas sediminilitoris]MCJ8168092.1 SDR family NAD(P)-dependent oxidoreductase [Atopomonas sediminilitoris]
MKIWLSGASSGLGQALALELLREGHQLAISARRQAPLQALAAQYPKQVLVLPCDLTDAEAVAAMAHQLSRHWGELDMAILNAGTCEYVDTSHYQHSVLERVIKANLFSASLCVQHLLPLLRHSANPHLVAVGSSVTYFPLPRAEAYGASKAALRYLFESLRVDLASENIAVTLVSPGFIDTPLTAQNDFPMPQQLSAEQAASYICRRLAKRPQEINFPALFIGVLKVLDCLPAPLRLAIGKHLSRNTTRSPQA